ncbi:MAG: GH116 family glycosyl-hydrolase [Terriglobia bacterium]
MPRRKANGKPRGRRNFLKTVALGAGGFAVPGTAGLSQTQGRAPAGPTVRSALQFPRVFTGRQLAMISFPLGGVGAGSIGLGGRGQLRDWQIFNRPQKGNSPSYCFASIWAQGGKAGRRKPVARVLEARFMPPYEGSSGLGSDNVPGLPRLASAKFTGAFPLAQIDFEDADLPVEVSLEAFTPFIPLDADESGLPVAVLRYRVKNPGAANAKVSIAMSIDNPVGAGDKASGRTNDYRKGASGTNLEGLFMRNPFLPSADPLAGSFALAVLDTAGSEVTYLQGWPSAQWWEGPLLFWDDFASDGRLGEVAPQGAQKSTVGSVCLGREIAPRQTASFTFLVSWHFPNRTPERCGWHSAKGHERDVVGNFYCTRFADAWQATEYTATHLTPLEARTRAFVTAMEKSTLPDAVRDAATANLSTLVSPTCFRTADGHFHGFEGCNDDGGCCFGSCTHVWNYESTVASLFPALSHLLRERQFGYLTDEDGRMDFREILPNGIERWGFAAADGQMGTVMKLYYDWRLSGDTEWLKRLWPTAKRALEFAWVRGGWDANRDGVMEGVQHNTYDVEFIGPNPLCGIWYLGALRAGEEMASAVGDSASAEEYRRLFLEGSRWIDTNLFNGEYYIQKIGAVRAEDIAKGLRPGMGTSDTEHPTFQLGDGCLVDQLLGQYAAQVAGLGLLLDAAKMRKALQSIYKYNFKRSLSEHASVQRTYALNDEAGLVVCDYGRGTRPEVPFPYFAEVWTGLEYSTAALMLYMGMTREGLEVIESARRRFDGERRDPWNEPECGHHYARAMAAWAAVLALSGFRYHGAEKNVSVQPRVRPEEFFSFWSTGAAWGTFSHSGTNGGPQSKLAFALSVTSGSLPIRSITLVPQAGSGIKRASAVKLGERSLKHELRRSGNQATLALAEEIFLKAGDQLTVVL